MKRILAITLTLVMLLAALTGCMASQNQPISGADLFSQKKIQTITFSSDPNGYQYSFNGSSVQKICDFFSSLSFTIDESPDPSDVTGMGWDMTISYEDEHSETIVFPPNRTYLLKNSTKYKLTSNAVIEIDALIDELKENQTYHSSCLLTIAETLPSCLAFEYKDEKPYCFYAYDTEGHLYRVLWNDFTGLNEKDVVVVDHNDDIKKLEYVNPPGGWTPKYEVTATEVTGVSASCISKNEDGAYILTLHNSGETSKLKNEQILFVPYITDELVATAENKITEAVSAYSNSSDFYLQINDGYLCLSVEVIKHLDPSSSQETEGEVLDGGCGIDHEHLGFSERISTQALEIGSSENPQKFKLSIIGDYADNIVSELKGRYAAGERVAMELQTITEHYYEVTVNGTQIPQADSDLEYTWFVFNMPAEDTIVSITQKSVDIPPPPADSDNITFQYGDILAQIILDDAQKNTVQELLADKHDWMDEMPESVVNCYFTGFFVKAGYCSNSGILIDYIGECSRKLTAKEKAFVESLISMLEEPTHSGYEVEIKLLQYTWDGWGISQKTVGACDVAYNIIDALKAMKETGETVPKISDEVFEIGGGQYAAERGTMWIESGNKIYRLTPDLSQICLVETHFGEGKVLEMTDAFKTNVNNAWHYAPYDYYKGTYNKGDSTVKLNSVFESGSSVDISIIEIKIDSSSYDPFNTILIELISSVDQEVAVKLHCQQSDDNLARGDAKTVELKKGVPTTVELGFGGWSNFTYWVYIEADLTKAEITINP